MSLKNDITALKKALAPKVEMRFTMNEEEIDESIPGVIWVYFNIDKLNNGVNTTNQAPTS